MRHITRYILSYCNHWPENRSLLHQVILLLGYFCLMNPDNQVRENCNAFQFVSTVIQILFVLFLFLQAIIQSGQSPSILEQLCGLPFEYFSDPSLTKILLPTLISCCYPNTETLKVLELEMSPSMLASFIEVSQGRRKKKWDEGERKREWKRMDECMYVW